MAKNGKKEAAAPAQTEETKEAKKNGLFLNNYPKSLISTKTSTKEDGTESEFVSVRVNTPLSKDGWGNFAVNPSQVYAHPSKENMVNILLAKDKDAEKPREYKMNIVSKINKKTGEKTYSDVQVDANKIVEDVKAQRAAYKAEQKANQRDSVDIEADGAEAEAEASK